jgi:hypothetical protein
LYGFKPGCISEALKMERQNSRTPSRLWLGETIQAYIISGINLEVNAMMKPCNNHPFSSQHCFHISYLEREVIFNAYT